MKMEQKRAAAVNVDDPIENDIECHVEH
jgi:hypothetical protein